MCNNIEFFIFYFGLRVYLDAWGDLASTGDNLHIKTLQWNILPQASAYFDPEAQPEREKPPDRSEISIRRNSSIDPDKNRINNLYH